MLERKAYVLSAEAGHLCPAYRGRSAFALDRHRRLLSPEFYVRLAPTFLLALTIMDNVIADKAVKQDTDW